MKELHENNELIEMFEAANSENTKLKWLTHRAPVSQNIVAAKFQFFVKISIFGQMFDFWSNFRLVVKISIFESKFQFFGQKLNLDFRPEFLSKISFLVKFSFFA